MRTATFEDTTPWIGDQSRLLEDGLLRRIFVPKTEEVAVE